jgi:hypothetical protein
MQFWKFLNFDFIPCEFRRLHLNPSARPASNRVLMPLRRCICWLVLCVLCLLLLIALLLLFAVRFAGANVECVDSSIDFYKKLMVITILPLSFSKSCSLHAIECLP